MGSIASWVERKLSRRSRLIGNEKKIWKLEMREPFDYGNVARKNLRDDAMNISADLPMQDGDMRPVMSRVERAHTRKHRRELNEALHSQPTSALDGDGMRSSIALVAMCCVAVALMFGYLWDYSRVSEAQKRVDERQMDIQLCRQNMEHLEERYSTAAAATNVAYEAKRLGLVSAKSVPAIQLEVPANAQYSLPDGVAELSRDTFATILGD